MEPKHDATGDNESSPRKKPKKPLSAYNFFFSQQRERMVAAEMTKAGASAEDIARTLKMAGRKKPHRKTHGTIGFITLAREIANKWKSLSEIEKEPFQAKARIAKAAYLEEVRLWKMSGGKNAMQVETIAKVKNEHELRSKSLQEIWSKTPVDVYSSLTPLPSSSCPIPNQQISGQLEQKIGPDTKVEPSMSSQEAMRGVRCEKWKRNSSSMQQLMSYISFNLPMIQGTTSIPLTLKNAARTDTESNIEVPQRYLDRVDELASHFDEDCFECLMGLAPNKKEENNT